jgi:hypothetical protein
MMMRPGIAALLATLVWGLVEPARAIEPLFASGGTGTLLHPLEEPQHLRYPASCYDGTGRLAKEHVYIFGVNGLNPMCLGNFNGMLNYLRKEGFTNTYFGQMYTYYWYANSIREIRRRDPQARIVLIGFSLGANSVKSVANDLAKDGTKVDLLIYLVGDFVYNTPDSRPANVARVINVRAKGLVLSGGDLLFNGADLDHAQNHKLECRHILVPSRRETLTLVMEELLNLACVPTVAPAPLLQPELLQPNSLQPSATRPRPAAPTTSRPGPVVRPRTAYEYKYHRRLW